MFLSEANRGLVYRIKEIKADNKIKKRLQVLGLTNEAKIEVINRNINGSLIFKIRGTKVAVSKKISSLIEVEEDHL